MEATQTTPRVYRFGPVFKTLLVLGSLLLIVSGVWGVMQSYMHAQGVVAQFSGIVVSMIPIAAALFGTPLVWRCKLSLYEDRLEYNGLLIDVVVRKADVIEALSPAPQYGMFSLFLTLAGQPFKKLHIAVLGHVDEQLKGWINAVSNPEATKA